MRTTTKSESALRRKAVRHGYKITKIRENSRLFAQYGPYTIADARTNGVIVYGQSLESVADFLET